MPDEDVAVVREAFAAILDDSLELTVEQLREYPEGHAVSDDFKTLLAALDRLQARLEAAEAEVERLTELGGVVQYSRDEWKALAEKIAVERDEARADAARAAETGGAIIGRALLRSQQRGAEVVRLRAEVAALENRLAGRGATLRSRLKWARGLRQERDEAWADLAASLAQVGTVSKAGNWLHDAAGDILADSRLSEAQRERLSEARIGWREATSSGAGE